VETLSALAPYAGMPTTELAKVTDLVQRIPVKAGLINGDLPPKHRVFLEQGSLQIQTRTGFVLPLKGGTPRASFSVPLQPAVVSLYAAEPCTFLCIPRSVEPAPAAIVEVTLVRPDLTREEAEALESMRAYFRKKQCELPSMPDLAMKIGKAIDDQNNANEDIARVIQLDPSLTARILSVVNSAAFGALNKITSIHQATARLGRNRVRSLVYSCLLKSIFKNKSTALKHYMEELWQHSAHVAALSFVLGRETPGIDPEQALLAGLVHDIGAVAVIGALNHFPQLTKRDEVMRYTIASLRVEAGVLTLQQWGLHEQLGDVVKDSENWSRVGTAIPENSDVVILAQLHALIGKPGQDKLPRIDSVPAFTKLGRGELTPKQSMALLEEADEDVREVRALIGAG